MERKTTKSTRNSKVETKSACCQSTKRASSSAKATTKNCGGKCTKTTRTTKTNVKSCS